MSEAERAERTAALIKEISESLELLESSLPRQVDGFALSQKSKLPWKALLYREALIWRIVELGQTAFENLTSSNRVVSGIVLTRASVEVSMALWYLYKRIEAVVDAKTVGDIDEYLMKLSMGTATGWPEMDSDGDPLMPRPVGIKMFRKQAEKDMPGYSHQYGVLSEYTHPNWAGTVLLYSHTDTNTAITDFGSYMRSDANAKGIGIINLSVALKMFHLAYNRITDLLPAFVRVCEDNQKSSDA